LRRGDDDRRLIVPEVRGEGVLQDGQSFIQRDEVRALGFIEAGTGAPRCGQPQRGEFCLGIACRRSALLCIGKRGIEVRSCRRFAEKITDCRAARIGRIAHRRCGRDVIQKLLRGRPIAKICRRRFQRRDDRCKRPLSSRDANDRIDRRLGRRDRTRARRFYLCG